MPTNLNPLLTAATPVEPLPINISKTLPPGGVIIFTRYVINCWLLTVGCVDVSPSVKPKFLSLLLLLPAYTNVLKYLDCSPISAIGQPSTHSYACTVSVKS